jgi:hypothetical protein
VHVPGLDFSLLSQYLHIQFITDRFVIFENENTKEEIFYTPTRVGLSLLSLLFRYHDI